MSGIFFTVIWLMVKHGSSFTPIILALGRPWVVRPAWARGRQSNLKKKMMPIFIQLCRELQRKIFLRAYLNHCMFVIFYKLEKYSLQDTNFQPGVVVTHFKFQHLEG